VVTRLALAITVLCAVVAGSGVLFVLSRRSVVEPVTPARRPVASAPAAAPVASRPRPAARAPEAPAPVPELGTLHIDADVEGALVFIDRKYLGVTPLVAEGLSPGTHLLNVTAQGFDGIAETIDIEPGPRELAFRFKEVRLDANLAVVHPHRLGSCQGQLVATPDGLRYEPTEGDHAFSVSLAELDLFQIDYQDRNLRLRTRDGRQYDFTDPDGNADRLFVFHRDVDKARQRLAGGTN